MSSRWLKPLALTLLGALLAGVLGATWLCLQAISIHPAVSIAKISPMARWQGKTVARALLYPDRGRTPMLATRRLAASELELGLNHVLGRAGLGQARVELDPDRLRLRLSLSLGRLLPGRHFNGGFDLVQDGRGLRLDRFLLGETRLPGMLLGPALASLRALSPRPLDARLFERLLAGMSLSEDGGQVRLIWRTGEIHAALSDARMRWLGLRAEQLSAYQDVLADLARRQPRPTFAQVLGELFGLAARRSARGNPVSENSALLVVLAEQVNGIGIAGGPRPDLRLAGLRLGGRGDYVEHLTLSAALAVVAGGEVADAAGLMKEMGDVERGGSGFSFTDLAMDRAGARLGQAAVASADGARRIQARLAGITEEARFAPKVRDLPEFLSRPEFEGRFGGVGGAGYVELVREIDRRIGALPIYRPAGS